MKSSNTPNESTPEVFMNKSLSKPENSKSNPVADSEAKIAELENELKKQKTAAEKGAKLMQMIWGDSFQSDSLH